MVQSCTSISRLKGFFRSGINYSGYSTMLQNTSRKFIGNLPDDLLHITLKQNNTNKKEAIISIQKAFEEAAKRLQIVNKAEKQAIFRLPQASGKVQQKVESLFFGGDVTTLWKNDPLYVNKSTDAIIQAEEVILKSLKQYFPQTEKVIITPIGSGQFSNGYKLEVICKDGKKLISDKAIKVYREQTLTSLLCERNKVFAEYASDETLLNIEKENASRLERECGSSFGYHRSAEELRQCAKDTLEYWNNIFENLKNKHGVFAEANISEYLRFFAGHKIKPKDGLVLPDMFGLGDAPFCLSEFIGKSRIAEKPFDFLRLGLKHTDFGGKTSKNNINGICYDLGGIISLIERFGYSGDKSVIRFLKKLFKSPLQQRENMVREFEAKENKKIFSDRFIKSLNK